MKRNQELLIEQHHRNLRLIRDNAVNREDKVEGLRAQHIVAQNKIHYELVGGMSFVVLFPFFLLLCL